VIFRPDLATWSLCRLTRPTFDVTGITGAGKQGIEDDLEVSQRKMLVLVALFFYSSSSANAVTQVVELGSSHIANCGALYSRDGRRM